MLQGGGGSGLGLMITKGIVEEHSGTIRMFSEGSGKGCTFTFILPGVLQRVTSESLAPIDGLQTKAHIELKSRVGPRSQSKLLRALSDVEVASKSLNTGAACPDLPFRFLVVDDSAVNRKMLCKLIKSRYDCVIAEASDGLVAVDLMNQELESGLAFDAVFMDSVMPKMDGPTASAACRASGYKGAMFGVTGNAREEEIDSFVRSGVDSVFTKPVDSGLLFATIDRLIRRTSTQATI